MKQQARILIVDDDEDVLQAAAMLLKPYFGQVLTQRDPEKLPGMLRREKFDLVLLDMNFTQDITSGREGFFWLRNIKTLAPESIVVLFTAYGDVEMAVRAIKEGAFDFVLKPWQNEKLLATLNAALQMKASREEVSRLKDREKNLVDVVNAQAVDFIGSSMAMKEVFATIHKVAATDANVLITGENGTGKELVARELHRLSSRSGKVFISVDMGALSGQIFENELFGHVKGAFTDAREDRPGRFEVANAGTLFMDEIGNLPLELQSKLLTVLQSRNVTRLGSNKLIPIDIRLISATNMNIREMVAQQKFRQDLLYRINTVEIRLPPLRERPDDIVLIAEYYLNYYTRKYQKTNKRISKETRKVLKEHSWPGNVRELQHAIERAVILSENDELQPGDFLTAANNNLGTELAGDLGLEELEIAAIKKSLRKYNGNVSQAAAELGLSRAALYRRMEKYDL